MIDIRDHGGIFGGNKYRKGSSLAIFGEVEIENMSRWEVGTGSNGYFSPKVNEKYGYMFWVSGNAERGKKLSKVDLETGRLTDAPSIDYPENSFIDSFGNPYVITRSLLYRLTTDLQSIVWSKSIPSYVPNDILRAIGGVSQAALDNGTTIFMLDSYANDKMWKIDIQSGAVETVYFSSNDERKSLQRFHVSKTQNCIYALKGARLYKFDITFTNIIWSVNLSVAGFNPDAYPAMLIDEKTNLIYVILGGSSTSGNNFKHIWKIDASGSIVKGPVTHTSGNASLPGYLNLFSNIFLYGKAIFVLYNGTYYSVNTDSLKGTNFQYNLESGWDRPYVFFPLEKGEYIIGNQGSSNSASRRVNRVNLL